jgi:hypothetical protein
VRRSLRIAAACALAIAGLTAGVAVSGLSANAGDPPNQGDPTKVLTVMSGYACDGAVTPGSKVEGSGLGPTIAVSAATPIVKVTIKSGDKAELVSATWAADFRSGTITISQDVSNYVVWTCAGNGTTTGTTGTTTTGTTETTTTGTTETTTTGTTETTTTGTTETTTTGTTTTGTTEQTTTGTTETTATTETTPTTETTTVAPTAPLRPPVVAADEAEAPRPRPAPAPPAAAPDEAETSGVAGAQGPVLAYTP